MYYDRRNPHHTTAYLISIVEIKDKLNSWMSERNAETEDGTPVYTFTIYQNENSRYKLAINKIPNDYEIIDIDELENSQAQKNHEQLEFCVDPDLRMIKIKQYPHIILKNSTGFKVTTTYKQLYELQIEFNLLFDATKNAIDSTSKALKKQKQLIDELDFESITSYLKDVPDVFSSVPASYKMTKSNKKSSTSANKKPKNGENRIKSRNSQSSLVKVNSDGLTTKPITNKSRREPKKEETLRQLNNFQISPVNAKVTNYSLIMEPIADESQMDPKKAETWLDSNNYHMSAVKVHSDSLTTEPITTELGMEPKNNMLIRCCSGILQYVDNNLQTQNIIVPTKSHKNSSDRTWDLNLNMTDINPQTTKLSSLNDEDLTSDVDISKFDTSKHLNHNNKFEAKLKMPSENEKLTDEWVERLNHYLSKFTDMHRQEYVTNVEYINLLGEYQSKCLSHFYEGLDEMDQQIMSALQSDVSSAILDVKCKFKKYWLDESDIYGRIRTYKFKFVKAETSKKKGLNTYETDLADLHRFYSQHIERIKSLVNNVRFQNKEGVLVITKIKELLDEVYELNPNF